MKRAAVIAAVLASCVPAWAGSPFYEMTEAQKRRIVVPDIKALTFCVAHIVANDQDAVGYYRNGGFGDYVSRQLGHCPNEMNALLELYESTYGDGEAEKFIRGPYLADLPRAVLSVVRPQLDAKVAQVELYEQRVRDAEVDRQKEEDKRVEAQVEAAARAEAEKQRFLARVLTESEPSVNQSSGSKRGSMRDGTAISDPVPPPAVVANNAKQRSAQDELDDYAAAHHTTSAEIIRQTGMSAMDVSDYIEGGEKGGQTPDQVISGLLAMHIVSIDQNKSKPASLGVDDMPKIVDTYKKNEMRFVRDFKGRHFDDDISFANARQNLIISGSYTVIFGEGGFGGNLTCETSDPKDVNVIADWNKGDKVHVSGDIKDVTFGDVQLVDCTMRHR